MEIYVFIDGKIYTKDRELSGLISEYDYTLNFDDLYKIALLS
jgi:hypothetical protein